MGNGVPYKEKKHRIYQIGKRGDYLDLTYEEAVKEYLEFKGFKSLSKSHEELL